MNTIAFDLLATLPRTPAVRLPRTENVRVSPFRLRAMQAHLRRVLDEPPPGLREAVVRLLAAIEESGTKKSEELAGMMLNVYAVLVKEADGVLWQSQRVHRGILDGALAQRLLDVVVRTPALQDDPQIGAHLCAVNDVIASLR